MKYLISILLIGLVAISCDKNHNDFKKSDIVYFETNNFEDNQNAVLAYLVSPKGELQSLPGSPFLTGGSGVGNPMQILGPDDSDTELKMTEDGKFLLVVNSGSNTIAVFRIGSDGRLTAVDGSPFSSQGETPVSIDVSGNYVYVVNKSQDPLHESKQAPNYTVFTIDDNGTLTPVPSSTVETTAGSSPAQALVSSDGKFLFGADFLGFQVGVGTLRSFTRDNSNGTIAPITGTPQAIPGMGGALGLWQHPNADVLYVGFPLQAKLGIYSINPTSGVLSFQSTVDAGPAACWVRTNQSGNRLYVLNSGENSVSAYNSSNPQTPTTLGKLALKNPGPTYVAMGLPFTTSEGFSFEFSTDENRLYIISQHTNPDFSIGNFNFLHVVDIASDGILSEPSEPIQIPVSNTVRPRGVVVLPQRRLNN